MTSTVTVSAAGRTHIGLVRRRNEDAFYQGEWLFAVADGLGGHVAGDIASATAIETLRPLDRHVDEAHLSDVLGRGIREVNDTLRRKVREDPNLAGMGTTLVAILRNGDTAVLANIGDSRAYLIRGGALIQISEDHTYRHLLAYSDRVPSLPEKLARFLDGRTDGRSPDLTPLTLRQGERILLCSDGLSSYVPAEDMRTILAATADPAAAADALIAAALDCGGKDNVTVMVIDVHKSTGWLSGSA